MNNLFLLGKMASITLLLALFACEGTGTRMQSQTYAPHVYRSVLDERPRMISLALGDSLWAAYDAHQAALYKVWKDGVSFDGAVYTYAHGPQPTSLGDAYLESPYQQPWRMLHERDTLIPRVQYRGHRFDKGSVALQYTLFTPDGTEINIREWLKAQDQGDHYVGLKRTFEVDMFPKGYRLGLLTHTNSLPASLSLDTDAQFDLLHQSTRIEPGQHILSVDGILWLKPKGSTHLTHWFYPTPTLRQASHGEEEAQKEMHPGAMLIEQSDCNTCHNEQLQTVGPAYLAVAERYATTFPNQRMLAQKIINGGSGNWGEVMMTAHPALSKEEANAMVSYILSLDGEPSLEENPLGGMTEISLFSPVKKTRENQGLIASAYLIQESFNKIPEISSNEKPAGATPVAVVHAVSDAHWGPLEDVTNFYVRFEGKLHIPQNGEYVFRLASDDGSKLYLDGKVVIDNDGMHGVETMESEVTLNAGEHPIRVDYIQGGGGKVVSLQWLPYGADDFEVVGSQFFSHDPADMPETEAPRPRVTLKRSVPGDQSPLQGVHPAFELSQVRPSHFKPKVGGIDFLDRDRMVVSTWDSIGAVYLLSNIQQDDPEQIRVKRIAQGLAEPLGLAVVEGDIYVLQKQELTQLIDHDGDGVTDEYRTLCNAWRASANFHEFAFGLVYQDGYFYATLATAIQPGGASTQPQIPDRGKAIRISRADGSLEFLAHGLRTPNGIGVGVDGELFIADNQGDWLPSSKIVHLKQGAWYGSRSVDFEGTANLTETLPVVWLPQDEIGNSPSQPACLNIPPYQGQMIHGEVTHGGIKRVYVEKVDGEYQGCLFRFTQGLEAGVNRLVWGPDSALYVGGVGNPGNWSHYGKEWYGLQRLRPTHNCTFEMLAVRARSNGVEVEFTENMRPGDLQVLDPGSWEIQQWYYQPTANYGGPKLGLETLSIRQAYLNEQGNKVFLKIDGIKPNHVVYLHIVAPLVSELNHSLWSTEAWYTMNRIPQNLPGFTSDRVFVPTPPNTLSAAEQAAGWELLFDGSSLNGWRQYGGGAPGSAWQARSGTMSLTGEELDWQFANGGDIITEEEYQDFELSLEWNISENGNSGIVYLIHESEDYEYMWQTGLEMQVLHDAGHPDGQIEKHRAGDLYDLISSNMMAAYRPGKWNQARVILKAGQLQHWLNGQLLLTVELWTDEWKELVKASKFGDMPGFAQYKKGHIGLQDHGDPVSFRNIKIRRLNPES